MKHALRNSVALELAETLEKNYGHLMAEAQAAAELRRLHAINAVLVEALEDITAHSIGYVFNAANDALEKAKQ